MNKEFSNIIIFGNKDIIFIKEKVKKILEDLEYKLSNTNDFNIKIDIIQDNISKITIVMTSATSVIPLVSLLNFFICSPLNYFFFIISFTLQIIQQF